MASSSGTGGSPDEPRQPTDHELFDHAVRFVDTMLDCRSADISPRDMWARAQTALVTAVSCDRFWPDIVSEAARKLQTPEGGIHGDGAAALAELGAVVAGDDQTLARWCELAARDAVYVCAVARMTRTRRRDARKAMTTTIDPRDIGGDE